MENGSGILAIVAILSIVSLAGVIYPFKPFRNRWIALLSFLACFFLVGVFAPTPESEPSKGNETLGAEKNARYWVTSERLNLRTCPSMDCGIVGQLFFREGTSVFELRDGWARVTEAYDASCLNGRSAYVDNGNAACDAANGIAEGRFAEWVSAEYLSQERPTDPAAGATGADALVAGSDDFEKYRTEFAEAAQSLVDSNRCTANDFQEMGGWVKSISHQNQPVYFIYCGGATTANRLYLNAETGEVFH